MSLYVVKKILAAGKGSDMSHLVSRVAANAPFSKTCLSFIMHTGLKFQKSVSTLYKYNYQRLNRSKPVLVQE